MEKFIKRNNSLLSLSIQTNKIVQSLVHRKQMASTIVHKHERFTQNVSSKNYLFFMHDKKLNQFVMKYNDIKFYTKNAFYDYINQNYVSFMQNTKMIQKQYFKSHPSEAKQYLFSILGGKNTLLFIQRFFTNQLTWKERSLVNQNEHHFLYEQSMIERNHHKDVILKELVHHYKEVPVKIKDKQMIIESEKINTLKEEQYEQKNNILYEISEEDLERIVNEVYEKITYKMRMKTYYGG